MNGLSTLAEQHQHYSAVRARLRGPAPLPPRVRLAPLLLPAAEPEQVPVKAVEEQPVIDEAPVESECPSWVGDVPLNMLAACSWRFLARLAALRNGVSVEELLGPGRTVELVAARAEGMYLVALHTNASMPMIGRYFDRDHTTVLHALRKHPDIPWRQKPTTARNAPPPTPEEREKHRRIVAEGYAKGTPVLQIAAQAGISRDMVLYHARKQRLTFAGEFRKARFAGAGVQG